MLVNQTKIDKPWGYEQIWAKTDSYVGKIIVINAGHRLSKQYHIKKIETIYVLEGVLLNFDENNKERQSFQFVLLSTTEEENNIYFSPYC